MDYNEPRKEVLSILEELVEKWGDSDAPYVDLIDVPDDDGMYTSLDITNIIDFIKEKIEKEG